MLRQDSFSDKEKELLHLLVGLRDLAEEEAQRVQQLSVAQREAEKRAFCESLDSVCKQFQEQLREHNVKSQKSMADVSAKLSDVNQSAQKTSNKSPKEFFKEIGKKLSAIVKMIENKIKKKEDVTVSFSGRHKPEPREEDATQKRTSRSSLTMRKRED